MPRIAADQNVPYVKEIFGELGSVETYVGRELERKHLENADVLVCRSTKKIDAQLLENTTVGFVGTATIGTDHVDKEYLDSRGIEFANAAGSNANSVSEYITEALLVLAQRAGRHLEGSSLGVIGCGNVGSQVVQKAKALGMKVIQNDPPLARKTREPRYRPLKEALGCDFVTVHVPLTREGQDATYHMVGRNFIGAMKPGAVFLNSSRGAVVDEEELVEALRSGEVSAAALDVWDGEPDIDAELLRLVDIGTPHIAGHSLDGKAAGTQMIYEAACQFLGVNPSAKVRNLLPAPDLPETIVGDGGEPEETVKQTCQRVWNILDDDAILREMLDLEPDERADYFDNVRRNYAVRREFYNTQLKFEECSEETKDKLLGLGFQQKEK
ncbi:MAG: 4-phosphoerythronate dehydrogenase [Candidatus Brocadiia bacterium]